MEEKKALEALKLLVAAIKNYWTPEKIELVEGVLEETVTSKEFDYAFEKAEALIKEHDSNSSKS